MSTSFPWALSEATNEATHDLAERSAIYTNFLTDNDREFASYALNPDGVTPSASMNVSTMSREPVATWGLDEIGYKYVPAYYHRDYSSDAEGCSWQEASQAIEDYNWAFDGEAGGYNHTSNNANYPKKTSETTPKVLEASYATSADSEGVGHTREATTSPQYEKTPPDLAQAEQESSSTVILEGENTSESVHPLVTRPVPDQQFAAMITPEGSQLQAAHIQCGNSVLTISALVEGTEQTSDISCNDKQHSLPVSAMTHYTGEQQNRGDDEAHQLIEGLVLKPEEPACPLVETTASTEVKPLLFPGLLQSRRASVAMDDHDITPSSDVEPHDVASPADTIAASVAEVPASATKTLNNNEGSSQSASSPGDMDIDQANEPVSLIITHDATKQPRERVEHIQTADGDTDMTNTEGGDQPATQPPPVITEEYAKFHMMASTNFDDTLPTPSPTDDTLDSDGTHQSEDGIPDVQADQQFGPSATPIDPTLDYDAVSVGLSVAASDYANNQQDTSDQATLSPLRDVKLQDVFSGNSSTKPTSPTDALQPTSSTSAAAAEITNLTLCQASASTLLVVTASEDPSIATATRTTPAPCIDISSIMASLATYSLNTMPSVSGMKRPLDSAELMVDVEEGPSTKKQKLRSSIEPTVDALTNTDCAGDEEAEALETLQQRSAERMVVEKMRDAEEVTILPDAQNLTDAATESAIASMPATNDTAEVDSEKQVDNIATFSAKVFTKEADPRSDSLAPLQDTLAMETIEQHKYNDVQCSNPEVHPARFTGPYVQTTDVEMQERITTASLSPSLESPIPTPNSVSELHGVRITFKPLRPPTYPIESVEMEMSQAEVSKDNEVYRNHLVDEMNAEDSEEPSEANEETRLLLANEPLNQTAVKVENSPAPPDTAAAIKKSTPAPDVTAPMRPGSSIPAVQPTSALHRELALPYGRRTTRSKTTHRSSTSSQRGTTDLDSGEGGTKREDTPTRAPSVPPKRRRTRSEVNKEEDALTKKKEATPQSTADLSSALAPVPKSKSRTKAQTNPPPTAAAPEGKSAASTKGSSGATRTPTRTTRRASAAREESRKAELVRDNIGRRLRRRKGEAA